ncbi:uncharacterized protein RCC_03639 [Ramularia collo-cygni]|uniref:Uncharacterized protein n=1 Tax=Ramularia collo-cygni TaxID=112498 RepID=A0A2D3VBF8_9PEZI|nr:uncharacterized protein RCC_03639 [Ramularia collo-cygni]CZT17803.1 uncharacterized protein RCC_03639 [Ramularia collo-cygni]
MSNPRAKPVPPTGKPTVRSPPIKNPAAKKPIPKTPVRPSKPPAKSVAKAAEAPKAGNWINRTVQNSVAGVGNYASSFVYGIGNSVNKVGEGVGNSIANTTRGWGQGVAEQGNYLKDAVGVGGGRVSTSNNPLGLAGAGVSKPTVSSAGKKTSGSNHLGI